MGPSPKCFPVDPSREVLHVPSDVDLKALGDYALGKGPIPEGAFEEDFAARGRLPDCDCKLIECVCAVARNHKLECPTRKALTCAVEIRCEPHNLDVCPTCDACTC